MRHMTIKTKAIAAVAGVAVIGASAGGVAYASAGSATPAAATTTHSGDLQSAHRYFAHHRGLRKELVELLRRTVHADLIVHTKAGYITVEVDRGALVTSSSSSVELKRPDGPTVSAVVTSQTRFIGIPRAKMVPGDRTIIVQTGGDAVLVATRGPGLSSALTSASS
jgi:hypothetical protein